MVADVAVLINNLAGLWGLDHPKSLVLEHRGFVGRGGVGPHGPLAYIHLAKTLALTLLVIERDENLQPVTYYTCSCPLCRITTRGLFFSIPSPSRGDRSAWQVGRSLRAAPPVEPESPRWSATNPCAVM
jgi:hypothetical protein